MNKGAAPLKKPKLICGINKSQNKSETKMADLATELLPTYLPSATSSNQTRLASVTTVAPLPPSLISKDFQLEESLLWAVRWGDESVVRNTLNANPQFANTTDALHTACLNGLVRFVNLLVNEFHYDVNKKSADQSLPINNAAGSGHANSAAIVDFLISKGAGFDVKSGFGHETPLQCCKPRLYDPHTGYLNTAYIPVFRRLVAVGADLDTSPKLFEQSLRSYNYFNKSIRAINRITPTRSNAFSKTEIDRICGEKSIRLRS